MLTGAGCELRVVPTPGHTADSVCLLLPADGALLTGDTVLGRGTTVIAGDGSLADYLASLDRLRALADAERLRTLLPGHGPLLADPAGVLDFYLAHRRERLAEVRAALAAGDRTQDRDRGPGVRGRGPVAVAVRRNGRSAPSSTTWPHRGELPGQAALRARLATPLLPAAGRRSGCAARWRGVSGPAWPAARRR